MGGLYGHLMHLHDNPDLTFAEIKELFSKASQGELVGTEKTDGQNLFVSYSIARDKAVSARNKSNIKDGGLDTDQLVDKFKGRGDLEFTFSEALAAFENFCRSLPYSAQRKVFGRDADKFYSVEIMDPRTANVVNLGGKYITLHRSGHVRVDPKTKEMTPLENDDNINTIENILDKVEELGQQGEHKVHVSAYIRLKALSDGVHLDKALDRIDSLLDRNEMNDQDTVGDFMVKNVDEKLREAIPNIGNDVRVEVIRRVFKVKGAGIPQIMKMIPKEDVGVRSAVKDFIKASPKMLSGIVYPLEDAIHDFAVEMLKNLNSMYVLDNRAEVKRLKKQLRQAIDVITSANDEAELDILRKQLSKIKDFDNITTASEGFVFNYKGNVYKFTGNFAPVNQILGILKFGRTKKVDPQSIKEEEGSERPLNVALFPGKFKPPHKGHFDAALKALQSTDEVLVAISEKTHENFSPELSRQVWELFVEHHGLQGDIIPLFHNELMTSDVPSPIQAVYEYINNAPANSRIVLVIGEDDVKDGRYNNAGKDRDDIVIDQVVAGRFARATDVRNSVREDDFETFLKMMPDIYQNKNKRDDAMEIFSLLRSNIGMDEALAVESKEIQDLVLQCVNEVYSSAQRRWACAQTGDSRKNFKGEPSLSSAEAEEMCTGPMKKAKKEVRIVKRKLKEISGMAIGGVEGHSGKATKKVRRRRKNA
tara:strand:- start:106 stop:2223 length:2118 start_codon:yes stop_codon:yes gene_type:complete